MSDKSDEVVELLRDLANEIEDGDISLSAVDYQPPIFGEDEHRLNIDWFEQNQSDTQAGDADE